MNCNERADNMSKRKLTDFFKPGNNKNVRKDVDSPVQNETIIETTTSQDKEAIIIEEDKPFHHSYDFCFPKRKFGERQRPCKAHSQRAHHVKPRQFDMDITSIRRRSNFDEFPRHFRVLLRCNFDSRKIHVVSTYFYSCNFAGQKCTLFPRNFFDAISMAQKSMLFPRTFFDVISMVEKPRLFPRTFISVISLVEKFTYFF